MEIRQIGQFYVGKSREYTKIDHDNPLSANNIKCTWTEFRAPLANNHSVQIDDFNYDSGRRSVKTILDDRGQIKFKTTKQDGKIVEIMDDKGRVLVRTLPEIIKRMENELKNVPPTLLEYVSIKRFKWVKIK